MSNITIELYYRKDEAGNTIIDREFMIKELEIITWNNFG